MKKEINILEKERMITISSNQLKLAMKIFISLNLNLSISKNLDKSNDTAYIYSIDLSKSSDETWESIKFCLKHDLNPDLIHFSDEDLHLKIGYHIDKTRLYQAEINKRISVNESKKPRNQQLTYKNVPEIIEKSQNKRNEKWQKIGDEKVLESLKKTHNVYDTYHELFPNRQPNIGSGLANRFKSIAYDNDISLINKFLKRKMQRV